MASEYNRDSVPVGLLDELMVFLSHSLILHLKTKFPISSQENFGVGNGPAREGTRALFGRQRDLGPNSAIGRMSDRSLVFLRCLE